MRALALSILIVVLVPTHLSAELREDTIAAWNRYVELTESRIDRELSAKEGFLVSDFLTPEEKEEASKALEAGEVFTTRLPAETEIEGGMVHHWLGSVFVPGAEVTDLVRWLQEYDEHHRRFDDVEDSRLLAREGDRFEIFLRLRRKKIVTVHYDTEHEVLYRRHGGGRISSVSRSTRIVEREKPEGPEGKDRGFLWRLNSYWRFQQVRGGVVVECESLGLSRSVPAAVRWLVGPYLDSVPRESLVSTLGPIREGRRRTLVHPSSLRSKR